MTQERLDFLKELADNHCMSKLQIHELISTVEEPQQIPSLIEQIFKAGGNLLDLYWVDDKYYVLVYKSKASSSPDRREEFNSILEALQFILQRTTS